MVKSLSKEQELLYIKLQKDYVYTYTTLIKIFKLIKFKKWDELETGDELIIFHFGEFRYFGKIIKDSDYIFINNTIKGKIHKSDYLKYKNNLLIGVINDFSNFELIEELEKNLGRYMKTQIIYEKKFNNKLTKFEGTTYDGKFINNFFCCNYKTQKE